MWLGFVLYLVSSAPINRTYPNISILPQSSFSRAEMASVFLGDLNDFINPSEACINPMFGESKSSTTETSASITIESDTLELAFEPSPVSERPNVKTATTDVPANVTATISLSDCLACSGCISSAESVLITQQSVADFQRQMELRAFERTVISIAPQVRSSLAQRFELSCRQVHRKLITLFRVVLGANAVVDTVAAADLALVEARAEFLHRFENHVPNQTWCTPVYSKAESSTETVYVDAEKNRTDHE